MSGGILAAFAHPDDEAFGSAGTLALYARRGVPVTLLCTTRGEVGEISDPTLATPETLGVVREGELRCAAEAIGAQEVIFFPYRDSGMAGTAENSDPRAFVNQPAEEVVARLVAVLRRVRPAAVLTFDETGGYGHPDHIAIHYHTLAALDAAADASRYPEAGEPWTVARLFFVGIPRSFFRRLREEAEAAGADLSQWDLPEGAERGMPDEQISLMMDVSDTMGAKWQALECHRTQFGPNNLFRQIPDAPLRQLMSREAFILARPEGVSTVAGMLE